MKKRAEGKEKYLRTIYKLESEKGVKSLDIAEELKISKPSVSEMLAKLKKEKLIKMESYGKIFLSNKGKILGEKFFEKHYAVKKFMKHVLKHNEETAEYESGKISHHLSDETIKIIENLMENKTETGTIKIAPNYVG